MKWKTQMISVEGSTEETIKRGLFSTADKCVAWVTTMSKELLPMADNSSSNRTHNQTQHKAHPSMLHPRYQCKVITTVAFSRSSSLAITGRLPLSDPNRWVRMEVYHCQSVSKIQLWIHSNQIINFKPRKRDPHTTTMLNSQILQLDRTDDTAKNPPVSPIHMDQEQMRRIQWGSPRKALGIRQRQFQSMIASRLTITTTKARVPQELTIIPKALVITWSLSSHSQQQSASSQATLTNKTKIASSLRQILIRSKAFTFSQCAMVTDSMAISYLTTSETSYPVSFLFTFS